MGDWSATEVVRRWLAIWPKQRDEAGLAIDPTPEEVERLASNALLVEKWRQRLGDLSWTMKTLKEAISRRANAEDRCSGAFWEGRYKWRSHRPRLSEPMVRKGPEWLQRP